MDPATAEWPRLIAALPDAAELPPPTGVRRLTAADGPALARLDASLAWISETWGGPARLATSRMGWAAFQGGVPVAVACSFFVGREHEDIGVVTDPVGGVTQTGTMTSQDIAVAIDRPAAEVTAFARNPANLPAWAAGLADGIEEVDGRWYATSPMGRVEVRFTSDEPGVLDHDVVLPDGEVVHNPLRVLGDGDGCRVVFTLDRRPGMTDQEFTADAAAVAADLDRLREVVTS